MKFATKAVHAGVTPDPTTGAIMTPIFQTSTYVQQGPGNHKGYEYSRTHNPTRTALQESLAALENGQYGICYATGLAATDAVCKLLKPNDEVIASEDMYGGTYRLFVRIYEPLGIKFHFVDTTNPEAIAKKINNKTRLIWLETPTNPLLRITDISAIVNLVSGINHRPLVCVDNTFASPYLQNPLDLGADMVMHSLTKYIAGHSDVVMGALVVNNPDLAAQLAFIQNASGATPGPQDCFLVLRGIKTLHLRMERACHNAAIIAKWLQNHPKIAVVHYPGLASHPEHELAKKQMRNFGGIISFILKGDHFDDAKKVMEGVKVFALAESLGGVESLLTYPAMMTHASIPREERYKRGLTDTLLRLSIGVEDVEDLIADLEQAIG
jgi:cystathionine beta-lyase/cystathionine gamma-synthase